MNVETLTDLFVVELTKVYSLEQRIADALATLEDDASVDALDDHGHGDLREELAEILAGHREQTETHAARLEDALEAMGHGGETRTTPALDGVLKDKEMFNNIALSDELRPIYYIGTAKAIERLELTAYEQLELLIEHLEVPEEAREAIEANVAEDEEALSKLNELASDDRVSALLSKLATAATPD